MKVPWRRGASKLGRLDAAARPQDPAEVVPEPESPVLCYSANGGLAHDDTGDWAPGPLCSARSKEWTRAVSPAQKAHAASLRPCPHCAALREAA